MKQIDLTPIYKAAAKVMAENSIEEIRLRLLKDDDGPSAIDFEINGTGYMSNFEEYIPTIKAVESGMMKLVISCPDKPNIFGRHENPRQPKTDGDCFYIKSVISLILLSCVSGIKLANSPVIESTILAGTFLFLDTYI